MKNRLFTIFLSMTILLSFVPIAAKTETSGTCGYNVNWFLDNEGTLTINGIGEMENYDFRKPNQTPWYEYNDQIKNVIIEDGVINVGNYAFQSCMNLETVTLPEKLICIGYRSFEYCYKLTNIEIPYGVTQIQDNAFAMSDINKIEIPDTVSEIGASAFEHCSNLNTIVLHNTALSIGKDAFLYTGFYNNKSNWIDGLLYIGNYLIDADNEIKNSCLVADGTLYIAGYAFSDCEKISEIILPDSVTSIGSYAFKNCTMLSKIELSDNITHIASGAFIDTAFYKNEANWKNDVLYIGNYLIRAKQYSKYGSYIIRNGTILIGESAFSLCDYLTSVVIPNSVKYIENGAFSYCSRLERISIPKSVEYISDRSLNGCEKLSSINVDSQNPCYTSVNGNLYNKDLSTLLKYASGKKEIEYYIPISVSCIGNYAFDRSSNLTKIIIPDSVVCIDDYAFYECTKIEEIKIPNSVTHIGNDVFNGCKNLVSIIIPDSISEINDSTFAYCSRLSSVFIPINVTQICSGAFYNCSNLTDVYYNGQKEQWLQIHIESANDALNNTVHYDSIKIPHPVILETSSIIQSDNDINYDEYTINIDLMDVHNVCQLLSVLYDENGIPLKIDTTDIAPDKIPTNIKLKAQNVKLAKIFIWHSIDDMIPLTTAKELVLE